MQSLSYQRYGAIAQLVEHLHGMQGVRSSSLLGPTEFHQVVRSDPCRTWRKVDSITEFCTTCCVAIVQKRLLQNRAAAHATDIRSRPPHKQNDAQQWLSTYEQWPDGLPTFSDVVSGFKSCGSTQAYFANLTSCPTRTDHLSTGTLRKRVRVGC